MKLRTFMTINAVVAVIAGIILVLVPAAVVRLFGLPPDSGVDLDGALYGSELILMGLVAWFARDLTDRRQQRGILSAFVITILISLVISIIGLVHHTFNTVGWIAVVAYGILFVAYGIYWIYDYRELRAAQQMEQTTQTHLPS